MLTFLKNICLSPVEVEQQLLNKTLSSLATMDNLEALSDSLSNVIDQGGTNTLTMLLNSLNSLLALKLTGKHKLYLYNTPLELTFNNLGGLVSIEAQGSLPNKQSKHLKSAIKNKIP
tara:strand:+ start:1010 stop:1360 length:351 start_codon:yes stop_codon:yes gene_type:complete